MIHSITIYDYGIQCAQVKAKYLNMLNNLMNLGILKFPTE